MHVEKCCFLWSKILCLRKYYLTICLKPGDSLLTIKRALEAKELARQQLRDQLDEVEKETRSKLQEIDIFNNQLKVILDLFNHFF